MKLIKKINNNYALAIDSKNEMVIVRGSGIGFGKFPVELTDLSKIEETYYNIDEKYYGLIKTIADDILLCAHKIVLFAQNKLGKKLNPNLSFTLADHINFTIKRLKEGIEMNYGLDYEIKFLHPKEFDIAQKAKEYIEKKLNVKLPKSEIPILALHILDAEKHKPANKVNTVVIEDITKIVQEKMDINFDRNNFNYYRFATHIQYLLSRMDKKHPISSDNEKMFESIKNRYPRAYECVVAIDDYFQKKLNYEISEEEQLYLMIHINRVCSKEDCYQ